jgi:hypothetical protein
MYRFGICSEKEAVVRKDSALLVERGAAAVCPKRL